MDSWTKTMLAGTFLAMSAAGWGGAADAQVRDQRQEREDNPASPAQQIVDDEGTPFGEDGDDGEAGGPDLGEDAAAAAERAAGETGAGARE